MLVTTALDREELLVGCLSEVSATRTLDKHGFVAGVRPPPYLSEPGEWPHGWQYYASSVSDTHFQETVVLTQSCAADQAHLLSHSGGKPGEVLCVRPTVPECRSSLPVPHADP